MTIYYKELRSATSLTETDFGNEATRTFNQVTDRGGCDSSETPPALGDSFSVLQPVLKIRSIKTVPYGIEHDRVGTNKNLNQLVCTYSTTPSPTVIADSWISTKYTGGTSLISLDLNQKGSEWLWLRTRYNPDATKNILKRSVFLLESKGTYSLTIPLPNTATASSVQWGEYLTGEHRSTEESPYGINNAFGKINSTVMQISPIEHQSLITHTFKKGQLLFNSYDTSAAVGRDGAPMFMVTLNFSYRVIDLNAANRNVEYPWLYIFNPDAIQEATEGVLGNRYQIPTTNKENDNPNFPVNGNFLYDSINLNTALDSTPA